MLSKFSSKMRWPSFLREQSLKCVPLVFSQFVYLSCFFFPHSILSVSRHNSVSSVFLVYFFLPRNGKEESKTRNDAAAFIVSVVNYITRRSSWNTDNLETLQHVMSPIFTLSCMTERISPCCDVWRVSSSIKINTVPFMLLSKTTHVRTKGELDLAMDKMIHQCLWLL